MGGRRLAALQSTMRNRLNVLIVAYACRPGESSERQVGWHWARLIERDHNVTVLTRATHRPYIEDWIASQREIGPFPEFLYYDLPPVLSWFKSGEKGLYFYYALWTFFAILKCRSLNKKRRWDITHFLTFGTLLWPQFSFLMNTPYVLGPVGGGERVPMALRGSFGPIGQSKVIVRRLFQKLMFVNPVFWLNLHHANKIFARTYETLELIPRKYRPKTELLLETALEPIGLPALESDKPKNMLQIVSVGRLITTKFNPLLFESLAAFKRRWKKPFRVVIVGDGPERRRLEQYRDSLGLTEVQFVGKKTSAEVHSVLSDSNIYFSTTMKEGGTWAFFEAISNGLPVVCLKVNGPDMIVGDGCGIKVSPHSYSAARDGLADGLIRLAQDPNLRTTFATQALEYVERNFTWERVLTRVNAVYEELGKNQSSARS